MVGRSGVKPCRDCSAGHDTGHRAHGNWLRQKSIAKTVVEEARRRDWFDGEAQRRRPCWKRQAGGYGRRRRSYFREYGASSSGRALAWTGTNKFSVLMIW